MASEGSLLLPAVSSSLQKCYGALREQHETWKGTLVTCTPLFRSLANLAEQMQASKKVTFANTPLKDFMDLPERLWRKQRCAVEALLEELQDKLASLQKVRDSIGSHVANVFQVSEQQIEGRGLESSFQRSALCLSLSDMLESLQDIESFYHCIYLEVKLILLQVRYENLTEMQALPQAWEKVLQHSLQSMVEDTLLKVSFFLEVI